VHPLEEQALIVQVPKEWALKEHRPVAMAAPQQAQ
jgi:hypothetical protein